MNTFLLTWNPKRSPDDVKDLQRGGNNIQAGKPFVGRWRTGNRKDIQIGSRVFMQRQGTQRPGLIGAGKVIRGAQLEDRGDGKQSLYCRVNWQQMLPKHELAKAELIDGGLIPEVILKAASSGSQVPPESCAKLEEQWAKHLATMRVPSGASRPVNVWSDPKPIATAEQFKKALLTVEADSGINAKQRLMLQAHYEAARQTITTTKLAAVAGYKSLAAANGQYGRMAHLIANALHCKPGPFRGGKPHWWRTLANGNEGDSENADGHYEWIMRPELVAALRQLNWASTADVARSVAISPLTFNRQFARFEKQVRQKSGGQPFTSFRDGLPAEWEEYKEGVRNEALRLLAVRGWKRGDIGSGKIINCVIQSIEIQDSSTGLRNNLVAWPNRYGHKNRSHRALLDARKSAPARRVLEQSLFDFFTNRSKDSAAFEQFCELMGTRYDLVAYLFFLKDWTRFMPIAPTTFDEVFKLLGVDLVTAHHCSWENYARYNAALAEVQHLLCEVAEVSDARLIDAHSFCWMLVRLDLPAALQAPTIPLPRLITNIQSIIPSTSTVEPPAEHPTVTDDQFAERDASRRRLGKLAQDIAVQSEQRRLRELGHLDPEQAVQPVWDEPTRGYDILSCELDGTPRHIEVKSARKSGERLSFFLSRNEWLQSRIQSNYWFYLVLDTESACPDVVMIAAHDLSLEYLAPVNYLASLRAALS